MRLPVLLFLLCTTYIVRGQNTIAPIEQLSDTIDRLEFNCLNSLMDIYSLADSATIFDIKSNWVSKNLGVTNVTTKIMMPKSIIEVNNFYSSGQSASYFGNGLFSNFRLEQHTEIAGLPVALLGDLVLQNNSINSRLSSISISFDHEALLDEYREKTKKAALRQSFANLSIEQQQLINEYLTTDSYRQILLTEVYRLRKSALIHTVDSLKTSMERAVREPILTDSLKSASLEKAKELILQDSILIDSLQRLQADMNRTERRVDSLYNVSIQKWNEIQNTIQKWQAKISEYQQLTEEGIENGSLKYLLPEKENGSKSSLLLSLKKFNVGSFRMRGSSFDVSSIPVHGLNMEIRRSGYFASIGYGKEGRQRGQFPDYIQNLRSLGQGRRIFQARGGIGMPEKSHFHLVFNSMSMSGLSDSNHFSFPKRNVVISIDSRYMVSEQFFIELTGSASRADFTGISSTKELLEGLYDNEESSGSNMAGLLQVGWKDKKGQSEYLLGYQTVGENFTTLGNLFLINNRRSIRLEGKQRFWNNRGQIKASYIKGVTNNTTDIIPGIQQNRFSGELSYRLTKRGSRVWGSYSPNFYLQHAPGSASAVYQLNLTTVGTQWMFARGKKGQWITMAQVTNYSDQSQFGDTSVVTGLWYGMLTQTYSSEKYLITVLANVGADENDIRTVRDINVDISQSFILKTVQISQGFQLVRRFYGSGLLAGGSGGIQLHIKNAFRASLGGTYLIGVSKGEKNQFYMNSTASWQF